MAGKNDKVDFLSDIGSMVNSQKEENQILRNRKVENEDLVIEPSDSEKDRQAKPFGRPKVIRRVERKKALNVWFDLETHKSLGRIKLEHDIEMKDIAYIAIRKFLDEYLKDGELDEKGINYLKKKLKELNG